MEKYQFKTNIKCDGCVAKVTPHLNAVKGIEKWEVNTENPSKILTVIADKTKEGQVIEAVKGAGFTAERL